MKSFREIIYYIIKVNLILLILLDENIKYNINDKS